jgi:UDP-N-acetylmuramate--alanine ligase
MIGEISSWNWSKISMTNLFPEIKKIYFIGIGGIGVSAVARMMKLSGKGVSGSEISASKITEELAELGVTIFPEHKATHLDPDVDTVVYTIAIHDDNEELVEAKRRGLNVLSYPQMLGKISSQLKTVAISGTHGKTTTTAMIAKALIDGGVSPTVIIGSLLKPEKVGEKGSNFVSGASDVFIVEACEYRRSFLNITPHILVITNIDTDHLDYYKDLVDIQSAFAEEVGEMTENDFVICNPADPNVAPVLKNAKAKIVDFTQAPKTENLQVPGDHNIRNAQAAFQVGKIFGIPEEKIHSSLQAFTGTWRRFEYKGETKNGALVYDDYGHHPTEIAATLQGTRSKFADKKIIAVFQPHLYSRTKLLFNEFSACFKDADEVVVMPIYAAREAFDGSITSGQLAEAIAKTGKKAQALSDEDALSYLNQFSHDTVILTTGAGDIYTKIADKLVTL